MRYRQSQKLPTTVSYTDNLRRWRALQTRRAMVGSRHIVLVPKIEILIKKYMYIFIVAYIFIYKSPINLDVTFIILFPPQVRSADSEITPTNQSQHTVIIPAPGGEPCRSYKAVSFSRTCALPLSRYIAGRLCENASIQWDFFLLQ